MNVAGLWDQLVDAVCRPPRDDSYTEANLVGGRRASFRLYDRRYYRQDVTMLNNRGQNLQGSHYRPCVVTSSDGRLPCVIYCHCNSGSRRDAEEILYHMLPKGITVFAFDFAGSGLSEGSYVTLGALEVDDLAAVVQYLREEGSTSTIGLWGRSMGAVTALLYSQQDPSVAGMVLDSPFSRLVDLMMELAIDQQLRIPKPLIKVALAMLKRSVRKRAGFSVDEVAPLDCVGNSYIPTLFGHAGDDTFVHKHHSERLFQAYAGDKNFVSFEGDHNSVRPDFFYDSALIFLIQALRVEELVGPALDLQALPEDALPHLRAPHTSIYVTASRNMSGMLGDAEAAMGSATSSPGSSPRSPGSGLSHEMSRTLNPPWSMEHLRQQSERRPPSQLSDTLRSLSQEQKREQQRGQADVGAGQQHESLLPLDAVLAADVHVLHFSEEEALQLALEASLQDARQGQQGQHCAEAGSQGGKAAVPPEHPLAWGLQQQHEQDAVPSLHKRYNPAFASSGSDGTRNPLYGGSSPVEVPHSVVEEQAMLVAAIEASLEEQQGTAAATAGAPPEGDSLQAATGNAALVGNHGASSETELRYYYGSSKPLPDASSAAAAGGQHGGEGSGGIERRQDDVPRGLAAQAVADEHAGKEAAAVRAPALQLQHALTDAAEAVSGTATAYGTAKTR